MQPVLYVEDEENDAMLLNLAFTRAGLQHPLHVVNDGRQALDYLHGKGSFEDREKYPFPCLVLLDLNLPRIDGFSVLKQIRTDGALKDLPVVIFTSSEQSSDQSRARELGATDYVAKPAQMDRLVAFAKDLQAKWLDPAAEESRL